MPSSAVHVLGRRSSGSGQSPKSSRRIGADRLGTKGASPGVQLLRLIAQLADQVVVHRARLRRLRVARRVARRGAGGLHRLFLLGEERPDAGGDGGEGVREDGPQLYDEDEERKNKGRTSIDAWEQ